MMPVGVKSPHVTVVGVTEQPETAEVLVVEHDTVPVADAGQDRKTFVTVLADVQPPVVVIVAELSSILQPTTVAQVESTCDPIVTVAAEETETPKDVRVAQSSAVSVWHSVGSAENVGTRSGPIVNSGQSGSVPLMLMLNVALGSIENGGGGPGGYVPGGKLISQPSMSKSSHRMHILKNHRSHGMTEPSSVAPGSSTEVVTGSMKPPGVVVVGPEVIGGLFNPGLMVVVCPFGFVVTIGVVIPVGSVMTDSSVLEMIVWPCRTESCQLYSELTCHCLGKYCGRWTKRLAKRVPRTTEHHLSHCVMPCTLRYVPQNWWSSSVERRWTNLWRHPKE